MSNSTVFNTTDSPVIVDDVGAFVGGGEWSEVDTNSPQVKDALSRGYLVKTQAPSGSKDDDKNESSKDSEESKSQDKQSAKSGGKNKER